MDDLGAPHFRKPPCRKSELAKGYAAMHLPCLRRMNEAQENWSRTLQPLYPETPTEAHQKNPKEIQVQLVQCNILWPARERHQIICTSCFTRWIVFVDKAHWISHAVAENGIAIATIGRKKTAKMWPWPENQGCPGMIGIRFEKAFPFWRVGVFSAMGKASFCEVNYLQMVLNGDEWQGKWILYITLICHRTEYHGSSCIWPAGSRCQETFMSQWLHWWLSSLYFVVSHKGICS